MRKIYFSIVSIVLLLTTMSFAAFGYFTAGVDSGNSRIAAANYLLNVQVFRGAEALDTSGALTLTPDTYDVVLAYVEGSASTGFCMVEIGDSVYHTLQIGEDVTAENGFREKVSFSLTVTQDVSVQFMPCWGTSVYYGGTDACYITGDVLTVG
ncbi:MAG: hypothetical protein IKU26_02180 [Clostridia bacterium]|nr:hypothetical protein [Clostridia bacterium]